MGRNTGGGAEDGEAACGGGNGGGAEDGEAAGLRVGLLAVSAAVAAASRTPRAESPQLRPEEIAQNRGTSTKSLASIDSQAI